MYFPTTQGPKKTVESLKGTHLCIIFYIENLRTTKSTVKKHHEMLYTTPQSTLQK